MNSSATLFILISVLIVAVVAVIYLVFSTKGGARLNSAYFQTKWLEIEHGLDKTQSSTWQLSIMNADKLLDQALRESRFKGATMGERMRSANHRWKNRNHVWSAHKIRNQIAHETNVSLTYETTVRALSAFKQGLKDLGAI